MAVLSSILFSISLILSVVIGSQTRPWAWGPSLLFLAAAAVVAGIQIVRSRDTSFSAGFIVVGAAAVAWFGGRALASPVMDFGVADLLLLAGAVSSCLIMGVIAGNAAAEKVFIWMLALLLVGNLVVMGVQIADPSYSPFFGSRPVIFPSGFYSHYNECANFLVAASLLLGGASLFGPYPRYSKLCLALVAVAGLAAVYFTRSRGGILAVSGGAAVFVLVSLVLAKRRSLPWFTGACMAAPLFAFAAVCFVYKGWSDAQSFRFQAEIGAMWEGSIRLSLLGIAASCIALHPVSGGGARSYGWECNRFWTQADHGPGNARPEFVHNEFTQAITDYGIVGAIFLVMIFVWVAVNVLRTGAVSKAGPRMAGRDALLVGGISALAGMMIQSSFSFVFHLLPGTLLLGICIGRSAGVDRPASAEEGKMMLRVPAKVVLAGLAIATAVPLVIFGWKGTLVTRVLWQPLYGANAREESKMEALSKAIFHWPQAALYNSRASVALKISEYEAESPGSAPMIAQAVSDYWKSISHHPHDALTRINLAKLLGWQGNDSEARKQFRIGCDLAGGMEAGYQAHFFFCTYLNERGLSLLHQGDAEGAFQTFEEAHEQFGKVAEKTPWVPEHDKGYRLKFMTLMGLGASAENLGDMSGALSYYDQAALVQEGGKANLQAGLLLGRLADTEWKERRPEKALASFREAKERIAKAAGLDEESELRKNSYMEYLEKMISFLEGAGIVPP